MSHVLNAPRGQTLTLLDRTGTGEKAVEDILQLALEKIVKLRQFPRCLIQLTLQVVATPVDDYVNARLVQPIIVGKTGP